MPRNYMTKNDREAAFQCIQAERVRDRAPKMGGVDYYDLDQKAKRSGLSEYALRRHCEAAEAMLLEVAVSGVTLDDPRIDYVEIQIRGRRSAPPSRTQNPKNWQYQKITNCGPEASINPTKHSRTGHRRNTTRGGNMDENQERYQVPIYRLIENAVKMCAQDISLTVTCQKDGWRGALCHTQDGKTPDMSDLLPQPSPEAAMEEALWFFLNCAN